MSATNATNVEIRFPSRRGIEMVAANTAASAAKLIGFREGRVDALKAAITEACINAIERGNPNGIRTVRLEFPAGEDSTNPEMPA